MAASCLAAFDLLESEPERIENLWANTAYFKNGLKDAGFDTGLSETPIIPAVVGEDMTAFVFCRRLIDKGVFVNPVISPAVPPGGALIRISLMATHSDPQIDFALEKFARVGREMGIIQ